MPDPKAQPEYVTELQKNVAHLDREQAFLVFATFAGDLEQTAAALNIRALDVLMMADEGKWLERLKPIIDLRKSSKPGDVERAINRALNFVQAHRMRMIIERVVNRLTGMTTDELEEYVFKEKMLKGKDGFERVAKLSTRALADLSSAIEKCHSMTYAALGDTSVERKGRDNTSEETAASDMYLAIAKAAQRVGEDKSPRAQLFDAQLEIAQNKAVAAQVDGIVSERKFVRAQLVEELGEAVASAKSPK